MSDWFNDPNEVLDELAGVLLPDGTRAGGLGAEEVVVRQVGQVDRKVWALVTRNAPGAVNKQGLPAPKVMLTVVADRSVGIDPATLNTGGSDMVILPYPGRSSEPRTMQISLPRDNRPVDDGLARFDVG